MKIGKAGGAEQMSYELISEISKVDHRNEYRVFCPRSAYYEWEFPAGFRCRGFFTGSTEAKYAALRAGLANRLAESVRRQPLLTPEMRALRWYNRLDFDLVHSLCNYSFPDMRIFPNVVTAHDLQHIHFPEFFTSDAWTERENLYRESVNRASHIICVSEYTRMDLHKSYGVPLEKLTTVWNIPSPVAWLKADERQRRGLLASMGLRVRFSLPGPLLAAQEPPTPDRSVPDGGSGAACGHSTGIDRKQFDECHEARQIIEAGNLQARVVHLGYRSPLEIQALYGTLTPWFSRRSLRDSDAGRGSDHRRLSVACSNTTSLPEIAGDAAVYFNPQSTKGIARAPPEIATDEKLRAELVAAGHRQKSAFSSRLSAIKTLSVYTRVFQETCSG